MTRSMNTCTLTMMAALGALSLAVFAGGCVEVGLPANGDQTFAELNPIQGMHALPSFKDQEKQTHYDAKLNTWVEGGMRVPPSKTVPTDHRPYRHKGDAKGAKRLVNPVAITTESLNYGKLMYHTNCIVCHGPTGNGNGYVVGTNKYPMPPTLNSKRLRNWDDGEIYHVITHGQGRMWSYKNNLYPLERWAVVNYVRALQRADSPEPQDLERLSER